MLELPGVLLLNEQESLADRATILESVAELVGDAAIHWEVWSDEEKKSALLELLKVNIECVCVCVCEREREREFQSCV